MIGFLLARPVLAIGGLATLTVAILLLIAWQGAEQGKLAAERRTAELTEEIDAPVTGWRAKLSACESSVDNLTVALEQQNAAVDRLKAEGDERTRRANAAIAAAQKEVRAYRAKIDRIARAQPSGDLCEAARTLIVETLAEDRQ